VYKRLAIAGVLGFLVLLLALSLSLSSPGTAAAAKKVKCRVVKRGPHAVCVKYGSRVLLVRRHHKYVKVRGKRKFKVVKRTYRFVVLQKVVAAQTKTVKLGGTPESVGKPAWASSSLSRTQTAAAANDGKTSTRWTASSKAHPQWWTVDLGEQKTILGVKISWYGSKHAFQYVVETSTDGAEFMMVADRKSNRTKGTTSDVLAASGRFVRIRILGVSPSGAPASASEIVVHAETALLPAPPSPTPTPEATPTPTAMPTPSATPTVTPTPTPSASPTATPTPTSLDVTSYGARGDGVTDDTNAILAAIRAARGQPVYFPSGTYKLASTLSVPNAAHLAGPSDAGPASTAWLKGAVVYGSSQTFTDLRIGDRGKTGIVNGSGASGTTFTRCQFRGGSGGNYRAAAVFGGGLNSCDHITFTDCNFERNLADHPVDRDTSDTVGCNTVIWIERVDRVDGAHMEYITFNGCHFGVSNGRTDIARSIGSPRMTMEMYQYHEGGAVRDGWHHITFTGCIFEAGDCSTLDAPSATYNNQHTDAYLTIDGCVFHGGGVTGDYWQGGVNLEGINYVTIHDNDFYPARQYTMSIADHGPPSHDVRITGNRFHLDDYSHGGISTHNTEPQIWLEGNNGTFSDNVVRNSTGGQWLLWLGWFYDGQRADGWTITGNTFRELRATPQHMVTVHDATNCTITGNTFQTAAPSFPRGTPVACSGVNTGTTISNNNVVLSK